MPTPTGVKQLAEDRLGIQWDDGHISEYQVRTLRLQCRCANCVDEWTHEKILKDSDVPMDVRPRSVQSVGRYALTFKWTDGHDTGIYTFEHLRSLCECPQCKAKTPLTN